MAGLNSSTSSQTRSIDVLSGQTRIDDLRSLGLIEAEYSLTPLQEAMLFESLLSDSRDLYVVQHLIEITGDLDYEVFQQAWDTVIGRHTALRTVFSWQHQARPSQAVARKVGLVVDLVDLTADESPRETIRSRMSEERRGGLTPDTAPLMRLTLFRISPVEHDLLWTQHHLVQDAWSTAVVLDEVFEIHDAESTGRKPELSAPRPFEDHVDWLADLDRDTEEEYWRGHVRDLEAPTRLTPPGYSSGVESSRHTREFRSSTKELTAAARRLAGRRRVTLNSLLVSALAATIRHRTRTADVTFCVVASGRPPTLPGVERMVGLFINTLPMRIALDDEMTSSDLLRSVQTLQAELFEHEHTPLSAIQSWSGLAPGVNLTDTLFAYGGLPAASARDRDLEYRTIDGFGRTGFPVSVTIEATDPLVVGLQFDEGSLPEDFAESFFDDYLAVLEAMVAEPDVPLGSLLSTRLASPLAEFVGGGVVVGFGSVVEGFVGRVGVDGSAVAVVDGGVGVSYRVLDGWSDGLAARFGEVAGHRPRVGVVMGRSAGLVAAVLGVLKTGGCYVPVDVGYPTERIRFMLEDSGVDLVVTTPDLAGEMADVADTCGVGMMVVDEEPLSSPGDSPVVEVSDDDLAYIMYTSGSTGTPKGVAVTHRGLANYLNWARDLYAGDQPISLPLYSSFGFDLTVTSLYLPLLTGGNIVIYPQTSSGADLSILDVFEDDQVDAVKLTPSHLALLQPHQLQTSRIHTLIVGGEDLKTSLAHHVHNTSNGQLTIYNEYGPTEATVACMAHQYNPQTDTTPSVPLGTPAHNTQILLLDQNNQPVPPHIPGEICVAGPNLAAGYHNNPQQTQQKFTPHPTKPNTTIYHTGDLATWTKPNTITYHSRTDNQLKIRGHRIEPTEIENTLTQHPNITQTIIDVAQRGSDDRRLVAYYTTDGANPTRTELRQHLERTLPPWMSPQHLVHVEEIPLTSNGKIDREALPGIEGGISSPRSHAPPQTNAEKLVFGLCSELLGLSDFGMQDNFFDLGGHSLLAMRLVATLEAETGTRVSPTDILLNTLGQIAGLLPDAEAGSVALSEIRPASDLLGNTAFFFGSAERPLFGIHHSPRGERQRQTAVLVCPPVGRDYMRSHWALRRVSRLLVEAGFHVMRFDYSCTGDSWGDREDMSFDRWLGDIERAAAELRSSSGRSSLALVGLRLGAALATAACSQGLDAQRLILWDAVLSGDDYLSTLSEMQEGVLSVAGSGPDGADLAGDELLGFPFPRALREELHGLSLGPDNWPDTPTTIIDSTPGREHLSTHALISHVVVDDTGDWDDYSALQAALLPREIPAVIVRQLEDIP